MDPRMLRLYNSELQFVREMGGEFARDFPKIAGRLGLDGFDVADPYVERLLEGFAFLTARLQLKLEDEFPRFTQHLLEMVYPHYLTPTPSMAIVQMRPNLREGALAAGVPIPRGTSLRSLIGKDEQTACEYTIAHDVVLWPLEIARADYRTTLGDLLDLRHEALQRARASLRIRLRTTGGQTFDKLALDTLSLFLRGDVNVSSRLFEQLAGKAIAVFARPADRQGEWAQVGQGSPIDARGFDDSEALLPYTRRSFQGYRLLHEYFAFPQRYLFIDIGRLQDATRGCASGELELLVLFDAADITLERAFDSSYLALFCTPAINLFARRADRIHLNEDQHEYHLVPDRTRPMDLEVYSITEVVGHGAETRRPFHPFYACNDKTTAEDDSFYTVRRMPRKLSARQRSAGPRSSYVGSEVYLALVDSNEGPYRPELRQLSVETLCTNRDLPLHMPLGQGSTDFTLQIGAPVESIRVVAGPTPPRPSHAHGDTTWRLVSHLCLNYLSLTDSDDGKGAATLRELLSLYADLGEPTVRREIESVLSVSSLPIIRHLPVEGMPAFGRGIEVTLACDESGFAGAGAYLFASVMERFFGRYVSINSFTETVLRTVQRGEVMRWPARLGQTHAL